MYDIVYNPRIAIKAQALSNFVAEWTEIQTTPKEREMEYWTINFNGSLQLQAARAGILVTSPRGESFKYVLQMHFPASNNADKYEALLHGLRNCHRSCGPSVPPSHAIGHTPFSIVYRSEVMLPTELEHKSFHM
jgi:hypothetical protein